MIIHLDIVGACKFMDWIYFSHNSHVGDLVTPALAQLDNIPEQLIDNFTTKYQTKVLSVCLVNTFYECHYKPNLSCEVLGG